MDKFTSQDGITAKQLKEWLANVKDDAYLVINGVIPTGLTVLNGKVAKGYYGPIFQTNLKGDSTVRYQGFTFTHLSETSDGTVGDTNYF